MMPPRKHLNLYRRTQLEEGKVHGALAGVLGATVSEA